MLEPMQIVRTERKDAAVIHLTVPRKEIQTVMGPAMREVMETVAAQGLVPLGPMFSHHLRMDPEVFDFEVGVPVSEPVAPAGRVRPGELPAATVARTTYRGGYEGLGTAWGEFGKQIGAAGHRPAADLWECYAAGPESSPDPSQWRTELNRPLEAPGQ